VERAQPGGSGDGSIRWLGRRKRSQAQPADAVRSAVESERAAVGLNDLAHWPLWSAAE